MSVLIQLKEIDKSFGPVTILKGASASFSRGQKIGMIGRNGAGKSTLCRIILREEEADSGSVIRNSELRLGYLEQHDPFRENETVTDFLLRYTGRSEWECGEIAGKFQLKGPLLEGTIASLAGGYKTRVKLAAMLLGDPNFLILDEPTNYLDLSTLIILENFLQDFNGGFLIISHDREFLKRTCEHTLELENGALVLFPGGIEEYFESKEEQLRQIEAYNRTVEKKKAQLQEFVDRFRAKASTASRARSKMKQIHKLKTIEIGHTAGHVRIRIPRVENKAGVALAVEDLAIGYTERCVARDIRLEIERGSKVAILGDNGQGKTTLLKTLAGHLPPLAGSFRWSGGLKLAYYAQHVFTLLHGEDTVLTHLEREAAEGVSQQEILDMAGCFLFRGDDVKKGVGILSGGERARLILAGLLLSRNHVLLLDEPTNHLDFETVEALGAALKEFAGTVFFISHDRTFVNMIAKTVIDIKDGRVSKYPGTYEDYVYHLEMRARSAEFAEEKGGGADSRKKAQPNKKPVQAEGGQRISADDKPGSRRRRLKTEWNRLQAKIARLELRIGNLSSEKERILEEIKKNPFFYSRQRNEKLAAVTRSLEDEEREWVRLQAMAEDLKKERESGDPL